MATERRTILDSLERDLEWWRHTQCGRSADHSSACSGRTDSSTLPDVDATLCRIRTRRHDNRRKDATLTLTNMMLLRARHGRLSAAILIDPGDRRGPRKSWPARTMAALFQISALQDAIARGSWAPLRDFVAILNPHDFPEQVARTTSWTGLLPLISNSRVPGKHRDLLMPDYSFAPSAYMTNTLNLASRMKENRTLPRGWPEEYRAIYEAGLRTRWADKQPALFWRGGLTSNARLNYATNLTRGRIVMPRGVRVDVRLPCQGHCTRGDGALPPEDWCRHQMLLSLPGTSFAVGFKYLLLCGSAVIRGHYDPRKPEHEQWFHPGMKEGEHFFTSARVSDLAGIVERITRDPAHAAAVASRGRDFARSALNPDFVTEYWHRLLSGYSQLFNWSRVLGSPLADAQMCTQGPEPLNPTERYCLRGTAGACGLPRLDLAGESFFKPIPSAAERERAVQGDLPLYRRLMHVLPEHFSGEREPDEKAQAALRAWLASIDRPFVES